MSDTDWLHAFVAESNKIEGIYRLPTREEIGAHRQFVALEQVGIEDLSALVSVCAPGHRLRDEPGLNVKVGSHVAPLGGPAVKTALVDLLGAIPAVNAYHTHVAYETLHPFTDGNGRSGRALWLWQTVRHGDRHEAFRAMRLGFLHPFYYETLANSEGRNV